MTKIRKNKMLRYEPLKNLSLKKKGIEFCSKSCHRIKMPNIKKLQVGTRLYVRTNDKIIIFENVDKVFVFEEYLYFTALGKVRIRFDCSEIYRYFNIEIKSEKFNIEELKQSAINDIINNNFEINFCKILKRYIKIIENVLNIHIFQKKIVIKQNKLRLSYILTYKLNNIIKQVNIN